ncbi:Hypothetical protein NTJ_16158 [Nesidiocoris tenuis]|uniref:Uncharacterized protein n=1 Tax=Nesidiocoris tenuis TaxID=355587 RepID=A0ABN7BH85_9HEMI|nr:Hypothetical protein NTJ_16158 [Nesidiocoris tenuis]
MEAEFSKCEPTCAKDEDTSSTEGLIDEHEEVPKGKQGKYTEQSSKEEVEPGPLDLDLLDSAFIREGTTLVSKNHLPIVPMARKYLISKKMFTTDWSF